MLRSTTQLLVATALQIGTTGLAPSLAGAEDGEQLLFSVAGEHYSLETLSALALQQPPQELEALIQSPEALRSFVEAQLDRALMRQAAREDAAISAHPELRRKVFQVAIQRMLAEKLPPDATEPAAIGAESVADYYTRYLKRYRRPAMVRAMHLQVATEAEALQLLPAVKAADPLTFRDLVRKHSIDQESKYSSGDLGTFDREGHYLARPDEEVEASLVAAAFRLKAMEVSDKPVPVRNAWSLVKVVRHYPARSTPLSEVEADIRRLLVKERREAAVAALLDQLRERFPVERDNDNLVPIQITEASSAR